MIICYIISIIIAFIFLFGARMEKYNDYEEEYIDIQGRIKYPVWILLIGFIILCIPWLNIFGFSFIYIFTILHYYFFEDEDYRIRLFPKIIKEILTKKI